MFSIDRWNDIQYSLFKFLNVLLTSFVDGSISIIIVGKSSKSHCITDFLVPKILEGDFFEVLPVYIRKFLDFQVDVYQQKLLV